MEYASREELTACLEHLLSAAGNYRILTTMSAELLSAAARREVPQIDEKLYLEVSAPPKRAAPTPARTQRHR